jgi:hypothetical protein
MVTQLATYSNADKLEQEAIDREMGVNNSYVDKGIDLTNKATADAFAANYAKLTTPISSSTLSNTRNINIPPPVVNTDASSNLQTQSGAGVLEAESDLTDYEKEQNKTTPVKSSRDSLFDKLTGLTESLSKKTEDTASENEKNQITAKATEVNEINKRIRNIAGAYDERIKSLKKNEVGAFGGSVAKDLTKLNSERSEAIAALQIEKANAVGDLETANALVKATIDAKYEPMQSQLDNYAKLIAIAGDDMSESEKFAAQTKLNEAKSDLDYYRGLQESAISEAYKSEQSGLAAEITRLNPASKTFKDDLATKQKLIKSKTSSTTVPEGFKLGSIQNLDDIRNAPVSNITKSVMSGQSSVKDLTPTDRKQVQEELYAVGFDSKNYLMNKIDALYDIYLDVPENYRGIIKGRLPFSEDISGEVKNFEALKTVLTREVARLNDVGMLSDQDVKSYKDALPSRTTNNPQVALKSISGLRTALTGKPNNIGDYVEVKGKRYMIGLDGDTLLDPITGKEI